MHDGLVSGWLYCSDCGSPGPKLTLVIDGELMEATVTATSRTDVPGGSGFVFRFPPTGAASPRIRVQCPAHPDQHVRLRVDQESWRVAVLGDIESCSWPVISGWFTVLDSSISAVELRVQGHAPIQLARTLVRPDVESYLGADGVAGFHVDLGSALGYAAANGSRVLLRADSKDLAQAEIRESPIDSQDTGCLPPDHGMLPDPEELWALRRRFQKCEIEASEDWHMVVRRVGLGGFSEETHQWADYFAQQGYTPQEVAARLVLQDLSELGVEVLDPLPASLDRELVTRAGARLIPHIAPILALSPDVGPASPDGHPPEPSSSTDEVKVAVAGLVHHKSGLGLSATSSLRVLKDAGIHACGTPFFPARGGWNSRLRASPDSLRTMREHVALLHLPLDRVIASLAAQPGLLAARRLIGYYYWETEVVPTQFQRALDIVDEVWCASEFVASAFRSTTETPVRVTGQVVDVAGVSRINRRELAIPESAFVVHFAFDANSSVARKNPNAAIDAFVMAFDGDPSAVLLLKIRNFQYVEALARSGDSNAMGLLQRIRENSNIKVVTGEHAHAYTLGLITLADCYLSLHRSEGYGYGIAEAMALGTPVVTTGYSGNMDLTNDRTAWLVPFDFQEILPGEYPFWETGMFWAQPDIVAAASLLHNVRAGQGVHDRVLAARSQVSAVASMNTIGDRYRSSLHVALETSHKPC